MLILEIAFTVNTVQSAAFNVHSVVLWFHRAAKLKREEKKQKPKPPKKKKTNLIDPTSGSLVFTPSVFSFFFFFFTNAHEALNAQMNTRALGERQQRVSRLPGPCSRVPLVI